MCPICQKMWSERPLAVCHPCNQKLELERLLPDSYKFFVNKL